MKFTDPYLWGMSTIRTILSRQEYLGHTVLRKSVSTNFKLHKRKNTDEDEQYVFYNTHELSSRRNFGTAFRNERNERTGQQPKVRIAIV